MFQKAFILIILLSIIGCGDKPVTSTQNENQAPVTETKKESDPNDLLGKWMRTDGNYTIEISSLTRDGNMKAKYLNPSPIHCDKTTYADTDGTLSVHLLLNDKNYPNCTYDLQFMKEKNILFGKYFQATSGQSYEVIFQKME